MHEVTSFLKIAFYIGHDSNHSYLPMGESDAFYIHSPGYFMAGGPGRRISTFLENCIVLNMSYWGSFINFYFV